jgi:hypothetical protein
VPLDNLQDIRLVLSNFGRGIISRVDERDAPPDSLHNLVGFLPTEQYGKLRRDFGYSKYLNPMPTGLTTIHGMGAFRIEADNLEYVVVFGCMADGLPRFWIGYLSSGTPVWLELTEREDLRDVSALGGALATFSGTNKLASVVDDYYNGWLAINISVVGGTFALVTAYASASKLVTFSSVLATAGWSNGDNVTFVRFRDTQLLSLAAGAVLGTDSWFQDNVSADRMAIGWQRTGDISETPLIVERINRSLFHSGNAFRYTANRLYLGREIPNYGGLSEIGTEVNVPGSSTAVLVPASDRPVESVPFVPSWAPWTDFKGGVTDLYKNIDEGIPTDNTDGVVRIFNVAQDEGSTFMTRLGTPAAKLPDTGTLRLIVTAYWGAGSGEYIGNGVTISIHADVDGTPSLLLPWGNWQTLNNNTPAEYCVDVDLAASGLGGTIPSTLDVGAYILSHGFVSGDADATCRVYITNIRAEVVASNLAVSSTVRLLALPEYDGYMLGRPVLVGAFNVGAVAAPISYYPQIAIKLPCMDPRLTSIYIFTDDGDETRTWGEFTSGWRFNLADGGGTSHVRPFSIVAEWNETELTFSSSTGTGLPSQPELLDVGRVKTDDLLSLTQFLGYGFDSDTPDIGDNWKFQAKGSLSQSSINTINDGDDAIRNSLYDGQGIHDDHHFADTAKDLVGNPLKIFLSSKGKLLGLLGQLGSIYAFKRAQIEVINPSTTQSEILEADVIAPKSIILTNIGIVYAGKYGVYNFPLHGGLREPLTEAIRDEWVSLDDGDKAACIAAECKDANAIIFSVGGIQYFYHTETKIWWKRVFRDEPACFEKLDDESMIFGSAAKVCRYPDRSTYLDDGQTNLWFVETQWMNLGMVDVLKTIRSIVPVILSTGTHKFQIAVYFDRFTNAFCTLHGTSVNGKFERALPLKVPNASREIKLVITSDGSATEGPFDVSELRLYGETTVSGKDN